MIKKIIKFLTVVLIISSIEFTFYSNIVIADEEDIEILSNEDINEISLETVGRIYDEPIINAKAAVIYDRETKEVLWGKNENVKKAMASTTKIMTCLVVLENCNLNEIVTISKKAANTGGSRLKLNTNDKITVNDLLYGLMLRSGNDAAIALAEYTSGSVEEFAKLMNKKAKEIGLRNTNFVTPHGLDNENHYTTAYELAILTDYALNNEMFSKIVGTKVTNINVNGYNRTISNTNELLGNMQGVNGVKTGFTNNAGRCLVTSCKRDNNQIITVVLGCDTKKQRTKDSINLIEYAFSNYTRINLEEKIINEFESWKQINEKRIYINKADKNEIKLQLGNIEKKKIPIKIDEEKDISFNINIMYNFEAPLLKNTKIGNIVVKNKNKIIETVDIYVVDTINRKNIQSYFVELLTFYNKFNIINMLL